MTTTVQERIFDFSDPKLYNPSFIPLMANKSEFLDLWGSAGSGKSHFEAQKEIVKSFLPTRKGRRTIVARKVFATLRESCYAQLRRVMFEMQIGDCFDCTTSPLHITNRHTGVEFSFRGFDNPEKIKSIVGADRAWYEEATESSGMHEILLLRGRMRGFKEIQLTMTYNPIDEMHWINEKIHNAENRAGHYLHHSTYKDNIRMLEQDPTFEPFIEGTALTDPNYYRVYGQGLWGKIVEGLIYANFKVADAFPTLYDSDVDDVQVYGLDFGFSNPTALIALHVQDALPKPRLYAKEVLYERGLDLPLLKRRLEQLRILKHIPIIADSARPEMIKPLRDEGYNISPCKKFPDSVVSGINDVRSFELQIVAGSKETIKEARNYQKDKKGDNYIEAPAKYQVDHSMDAIRYGVQKFIKPKKTERKPRTSVSASMFE